MTNKKILLLALILSVLSNAVGVDGQDLPGDQNSGKNYKPYAGANQELYPAIKEGSTDLLFIMAKEGRLESAISLLPSILYSIQNKLSDNTDSIKIAIAIVEVLDKLVNKASTASNMFEALEKQLESDPNGKRLFDLYKNHLSKTGNSYQGDLVDTNSMQIEPDDASETSSSLAELEFTRLVSSYSDAGSEPSIAWTCREYSDKTELREDLIKSFRRSRTI
jgi:hypothetical protein